MNKSTLGLIETNGFIGAVEALDTAVKAANVEFVSCEFVKGGIVTILITGDVASVKAAVEASAIAVEKLGVLRNTHVIARTSDGVWDILQNRKKLDLEKNEPEETKVCLNEEEKSNIAILEVQEKPDEESNKVIYETRKELEDAKVTELRTLARELKIKSLTKKQIKYSKKEQLIEAILAERMRR